MRSTIAQDRDDGRVQRVSRRTSRTLAAANPRGDTVDPFSEFETEVEPGDDRWLTVARGHKKADGDAQEMPMTIGTCSRWRRWS